MFVNFLSSESFHSTMNCFISKGQNIISHHVTYLMSHSTMNFYPVIHSSFTLLFSRGDDEMERLSECHLLFFPKGHTLASVLTSEVKRSGLGLRRGLELNVRPEL